jgi:hypothetical protein
MSSLRSLLVLVSEVNRLPSNLPFGLELLVKFGFMLFTILAKVTDKE